MSGQSNPTAGKPDSQQLQSNGKFRKEGSSWVSGLQWRKHDKTPEPAKDPFHGTWHFNGQMSYRHPPQWNHDVEKGIKHNGKHEYKNAYGKTSKTRAPGVETYLSTTRYEPRKLIVQASNDCNLAPLPHWHRRHVSGSVPAALRISEWTLSPAFSKSTDNQRRVRWLGIPEFILRTLLVALPLQLYMSFPIFTPPWEEAEPEDTYVDWPGVFWNWPKFAVNPLDMQPGVADGIPRKLSSKPRLIRPRLLMVLEGDRYVKKDLEKDSNARQPYIMVSFANMHFHARDNDPQSERCRRGRETLKRIARWHAEEAGVKAYWVDWECSEPEDGDLKDADINRFCDVIRGASRLVIALPDRLPKSALDWGNRMWTLPEGLLATGSNVHVHYADTDQHVVWSKLDLAANMWSELYNKDENGEHVEATRLLAEHYTGTLQLSRLQLMSTAIVALWDRKVSDHTPAELAHALMGLLHTRIDPVKGNKLFQDIAKLSLLNDSDQLIERMVCLLPEDHEPSSTKKAVDSHEDPFKMISQPDQFQTYLWDVHPTCQVVGVDQDDQTVILNECRAIAIRWKKFPKMLYKRSPSLKKLIAELFLRSGAWWFITAFGLAWTYIPFWISNFSGDGQDDLSPEIWLVLTIAFFLGVGSLLSLLGPLSMRILYGGMVLEPAPHLVGFEGTMPIDKLEKIIFGNYTGRLQYAPSSTPFCRERGFRNTTERVGIEPSWVSKYKDHPAPAVKPGYRLFTLVDTGNLEVSVFQAKRPPTVALICGKEGGMLRTVLCSWSFIKKNDCLHKETVIRLPTESFSMSTPKGWLRLHLGSNDKAEED